MTRLFCIISVVLLLLSGCGTKRIPFPEAELAGIQIAGDISLNGEFFLIDQLEEKQVGSEQEITLEPVSTYSDQWYQVHYLGNCSIQKADPRYEQYVLRTKADKEGKFSFKGVGPGEYYLTGILPWRAQDCSANWVNTKVPVSIKVNIKNNDTVRKIDLTKPYESPPIVCDVYTQGDWENEDPTKL